MSAILKLLALVLTFYQGQCANVLYIHGVVSPSHHLWNRVLAKQLANIGHNVTFLSVNKPTSTEKNLHYIVFEDVYENMESMFAEMDGKNDTKYNMVDVAKQMSSNKLMAAFGFSFWATFGCKAIMKAQSGIDKILSYPNDFKFDLIIHDATTGPCLLPLSHKFNYPPLIGVTPFLNPTYSDLIIGGHKYPAYVPHYLINFTQIMNFFERFYNHLLYLIERL
jgi:hypothetical protein